MQKIVKNGQIVIEILKIQFWTCFFLDHPVYVISKGYDNFSNSWIDKKDIVN